MAIYCIYNMARTVQIIPVVHKAINIQGHDQSITSASL